MATLDAALMPRHLDADGQAVWWALGTIARWNALVSEGGDPALLISQASAIFGSDEEDWSALVADTPQIDELTPAQRRLLVDTLRHLERSDLGRRDGRSWWDD